LLLLCLALPGCATTSGRDWLDAPLEPHATVSAQTSVAPTVVEEPSEARPRLRHTVTLGESFEPPPEAPMVAAGGPSVQVNVSTPVYVSTPAYGYGYGYGYGYSSRGAAYGDGGRVSNAPVRATPSAPTKVGGDFPAPPDYGPRALR